MGAPTPSVRAPGKLGRVFDLNRCSSELHKRDNQATTRSLLKLDQAHIAVGGREHISFSVGKADAHQSRDWPPKDPCLPLELHRAMRPHQTISSAIPLLTAPIPARSLCNLVGLDSASYSASSLCISATCARGLCAACMSQEGFLFPRLRRLTAWLCRPHLRP